MGGFYEEVGRVLSSCVDKNTHAGTTTTTCVRPAGSSGGGAVLPCDGAVRGRGENFAFFVVERGDTVKQKRTKNFKNKFFRPSSHNRSLFANSFCASAFHTFPGAFVEPNSPAASMVSSPGGERQSLAADVATTSDPSLHRVNGFVNVKKAKAGEDESADVELLNALEVAMLAKTTAADLLLAAEAGKLQLRYNEDPHASKTVDVRRYNEHPKDSPLSGAAEMLSVDTAVENCLAQSYASVATTACTAGDDGRTDGSAFPIGTNGDGGDYWEGEGGTTGDWDDDGIDGIPGLDSRGVTGDHDAMGGLFRGQSGADTTPADGRGGMGGHGGPGLAWAAWADTTPAGGDDAMGGLVRGGGTAHSSAESAWEDTFVPDR